MIWLIVAFAAVLQLEISRRNGERMKASIALTVGYAAFLIAFHRELASIVGYAVIAVSYVFALWQISKLKQKSQIPLPPK